MSTINDSHMLYASWDIECSRHIFLSFWTIFLPFYPPNNPKNQNFEKLKKAPGDIIILHKCTINDNQYDVWFQRYQVQWTDLYVILDHFLPFYPPNSSKNENFKKNEKNAWRSHHFTEVYQKLWSYVILFLRYGMWQM